MVRAVKYSEVQAKDAVHEIDGQTLRYLARLGDPKQVETRLLRLALEDVQKQRCEGVCRTYDEKRPVSILPEPRGKSCQSNVEQCHAHLDKS
jgi:hypothetical protein